MISRPSFGHLSMAFQPPPEKNGRRLRSSCDFSGWKAEADHSKISLHHFGWVPYCKTMIHELRSLWNLRICLKKNASFLFKACSKPSGAGWLWRESAEQHAQDWPQKSRHRGENPMQSLMIKHPALLLLLSLLSLLLLLLL